MRSRRMVRQFLLLALWTATAWARVWYVRSDAPPDQSGATWAEALATIAAAAEKAWPGDQIWAAEGTYVGRVTLPGSVALYGGFVGGEAALDARDWRIHATVIDAAGKNRALTCGEDSVVDGVVITGATYSAVLIGEYAATLRNCYLHHNGVYGTDFSSEVVYLSSSSAQIIDCVIADNAATAIKALRPKEGFAVRGCRLLRNAQNGAPAAGISCEEGTSLVENCLIACNSGDGIRLTSCANMSIGNVTIADNDGAGVNVGACTRDPTITIADSILWANAGGSIAGTKPVSVAYTCAEGDAPPDGQGNIAADPRFSGFGSRGEVFVDPNAADDGDGSAERPYRSLVSAAASYEYSLCAGSPCLGAAGDGGAMGAPLGTAACTFQEIPVITCAAGVQDIGRLRFGLTAHIRGSSSDTCVIRGILDGPRSGCRVTGFAFEGAGSELVIGAGNAPEIADCRFSDARIVSRGLHATLARCVMTGGASRCSITVAAGRLLVLDTEVAGNAAGGVYVGGKSDARLSGCVFRGNGGGDDAEGNAYGGAVHVDGGVLTAERCLFEGNTARGMKGGGIFATGTAVIKDCLFVRNTAFYSGGAISTDTATVTVEGCHFEHNVAGSGAAVNCSASTGTIRTTVFRGNVATEWGAGLRASSRSTIACEHLTLCGNAAPSGAGILSGFGSSITAVNCIAWGNLGGNLTAVLGGQVSATYSCIGEAPLPPGIGNIDADPRFEGWGQAAADAYVDSGAAPGGDGTEARPFASLRELVECFSLDLCEDSPCIGAGAGGVTMGAGHAIVPAAQAHPVTAHLAAGAYDTGVLSIAYDVALAGAGADVTVVRGSLWGLGAGRAAEDLTITDGTARLLVAYGDAVVRRCVFSASRPVAYDTDIGIQVAVHVTGGSLTVADCRFTDNDLWALSFDGAACAIERCRFERNRGGSVSLANGDVRLADCLFLDNVYGLYLSRLPRARCANIEMRGHTWSTLAVMDSRDVVFTNCTVVENEGNSGAVIECVDSTCRFEHATVARNTPAVSAALDFQNCAAEIVNSIIWANSIAGIAMTGFAPNVTYSCVQGTAPWPGAGNIALDPRFAGWGDMPDVVVDPAAPAGGDGSAARPFAAMQEALQGFAYALGAESPCIGTGAQGATMGADWGVAPSGATARTIHVAAGVVASPRIILREETTIQGAGADRTFIEASVTGLGRHSSLRSLCIRGSSSYGVSIAPQSDPLIEDCLVTACTRGIICGAGSNPVLRNVVIRGNDAGRLNGGGISCAASSHPLLDNCEIVENRATHGGGIFCEEGAALSLHACTVAGNAAENGGGIHVGAGASAAIDACLISDNQGKYGAGVFCGEQGRMTMNDVMIARNGGSVTEGAGMFGGAGASLECRAVRVVENFCTSPSTPGVGISWHGAEFVFIDSEISKNAPDLAGSYMGSLTLVGVAAARLERVRIAHNSTGVYLSGCAGIEAVDVVVRGNLDTGLRIQSMDDARLEDWVVVENGRVGVRTSGTVTLARCTIASNEQWDIQNSGALSIEDSIVWNDALSASITSTGQYVRAAYSCIRAPAVMPGDGNTNTDPRFAGWGGRAEIFVDAGAPAPGDGSRDAPFPELWMALGAYSYALCEDSPCIGTAAGGGTMGALRGTPVPVPVVRDTTVFCAAGSYAVVRADLGRRVTLIGAGAGATVLHGTVTGLRDGHALEHATVTGSLNSGITVADAHDFAVRDVHIIENSGTDGGGLSCRRSRGVVERCVFHGNAGTESGGAAWLDETSEIAFTGCEFTRNWSRLGNGGAVCGGLVEVQACTFTENAAFEGAGGAIQTNVAASTITASRFECNWASRGGAVHSVASLRGCDFVGNTAEQTGGACSVVGDLSARPVIEGCRFLGNAVTLPLGMGGALFSQYHAIQVVNCVLAGNITDAIHVPPATAGAYGIVHCAFDANTQAVAVSEDGRSSALNSIFWRTGAAEAPLDFFFCLTDRDPRFVRPGTFTLRRYRTLTIGGRELIAADFVDDEGDYHLRADSPAIDAGASDGAPATDMDGRTRPCGATFDLGPYEACDGGTAFRRGDANTDGRFDFADPVFCLQYLFARGSAPMCFDAADANDDGALNISDGTRMLGALFRDRPLPFPYNTCGEDPTEDGLEPCIDSACR